MTASDWDVVIKAVLALISGVVVPWAIVAYQRRTGVQVTDQQRAAIDKAMNTAAGIIQTKLDQGRLSVQDITPTNPTVFAEATAALDRVSEAAVAQGTTNSTAASIVVARVDTAPKPVPVVVPVAVKP